MPHKDLIPFYPSIHHPSTKKQRSKKKELEVVECIHEKHILFACGNYKVLILAITKNQMQCKEEEEGKKEKKMSPHPPPTILYIEMKICSKAIYCCEFIWIWTTHPFDLTRGMTATKQRIYHTWPPWVSILDRHCSEKYNKVKLHLIQSICQFDMFFFFNIDVSFHYFYVTAPVCSSPPCII